jgi:hypothetical protein
LQDQDLFGVTVSNLWRLATWRKKADNSHQYFRSGCLVPYSGCRLVPFSVALVVLLAVIHIDTSFEASAHGGVLLEAAIWGKFLDLVQFLPLASFSLPAGRFLGHVSSFRGVTLCAFCWGAHSIESVVV